ncbi:MAG: IS481 family transposase, partial [Rickettsia endosymbiont of Eriopis connexa]|nr:IS481 family transposase [Rickettsia endosymbiont of Eriopis connexa]MCC8467912.1 IS481 family transposase [Rickettsia endosymbiont of Eriopis connexa]
FKDSKKLAVEKNNEILYLEYVSDSQNLTDNQVQNLQCL